MVGRYAVLLVALGLNPFWSAGAAEAPGSDWDWSGFTGLDDAPVTKPSVGSAPHASEPVTGSPRGENAIPDYAAPVRAASAMFKDMPPFEVVPSQRDPGMHPCSNCHQWVLSDPRPRQLKKPHNNFELKHGLHGKGKLWCFTCHDLSGTGGLKTLEGEKLDFGDAYILCSQCHSNQARDWVYGAHGKRVSGWQGARRVLNCTACHYQHHPRLKGREPQPGPNVRMGLPRPPHWSARDSQRPAVHGYETIWRREREPTPSTDSAGGADHEATAGGHGANGKS